ncbi:hypothetical protein BH09BAC1_BH09BAC1_24200 [soil metagenome]
MAVITYRNYVQHNAVYPWSPMVPTLFIPVLAYLYWKNHRKYSSVYVSIRTYEDTIATAAPNLFEVVIQRSEVLAIHELPDQTLIVAKDGQNRIMVPSFMEGYEEVRMMLSRWGPFIPVQSLFSFVSFYRVFPVVVFLVGLLGSLIFRTFPLLGFFVAFCAAGGLHTFFILHKLRKPVPQIARFRWFVLFMVVIICVKAYNVYMLGIAE